MTDSLMFYGGLAVMAGVTYLIRMIPLVLFGKKITNKYINSFLYYVPYTVLAAMTVPAVFFSTSSAVSAAVGFCVAVILALFKRGLLTVAACASLAVFLTELFL